MDATMELDRPQLDQIIEPMLRAAKIGAGDVLALKRDVFRDGAVSRTEAELLFDLNDRCRDRDPAWNDFFVDTLTDFFVWQQHPKGYLSDEDARFLVDRITCDGHIDNVTELELIINVCHWAKQCPEEVIVLALSAVEESVLGGGGVLFGAGRRRAGVIDEADVEIIRRLIYAAGSGGGLTVTRREADLLFDLNDATSEKDNAGGWQDLFVKAIASHVMYPRGAPSVPCADEARRRETWLGERRSVGGLLRGMASSMTPGGFAEAWRSADLFGRRGRQQDEARRESEDREADVRESIDEVEAAWLLGRIHCDGRVHANEAALLGFIKTYAPRVHPSLLPLLKD